MANSAAYWRKRSALLMFDRMEGAEQISTEIAEVYQDAYNEIADRLANIFDVYARKYKLTQKQAKMVLGVMKDPGDIDGLFNALSAIGTDEALAMRAELSAPAYRARIARLQKLQSDIKEQAKTIYGKDLNIQTGWYRQLANETYYRTIYDVQREVGYGFSFAHINSKQINAVMNSAWAGATFSQTLWNNVTGVQDEVRRQLTLGLLTGKTEREMAKDISERYAVGSFQSRRLVRTESCYLSNEIQFNAYEECGADRYQYVATLDSRTDEECGALDRQIFYIKEKQPGINAPPMHPFCRCTTKIYIDQNERDDLRRRARDPKTGKNVIVPASLTYTEWAKQNGIKPKKKKTSKA